MIRGVGPSERMRELAIRHAAFAWLDRQRASGKETFTQADTSGLQLAGETIRLMPTQQGIWKPGQLEAALSFRTVFRREGIDRPYDDAVGIDPRTSYRTWTTVRPVVLRCSCRSIAAGNSSNVTSPVTTVRTFPVRSSSRMWRWAARPSLRVGQLSPIDRRVASGSFV